MIIIIDKLGYKFISDFGSIIRYLLYLLKYYEKARSCNPAFCVF